MKIPLVDLHEQMLGMKTEILQVIEKVLDSGNYILGPEVKKLEEELALLTQSQHAISTANGTDALVLALHACGIGPGDEVITTPFTFFATAEAIVRAGAVPVFADIDPKTYNLSAELVEKKITEKTKAIIPVHLFGQPVDMDSFLELGNRHHLYVIEDACQALGASYKGKPVGSLGDVGCVSFFPTKNLGGYGDGGMVFTNNPDIAETIRLLSLHGSKRKYFHDVIGYNSRLDELQAAVLRVKLTRLTTWNQTRLQKALYYTQHLHDLNRLSLPFIVPKGSHVFHLYTLQTEDRKALMEALHHAGVATGHYYPCPLHLQRAFSSLSYLPGDFPVAEMVSKRSLALPLYPELTVQQQDYVIALIRDFYKAK